MLLLLCVVVVDGVVDVMMMYVLGNVMLCEVYEYGVEYEYLR